MAGKYNAEFESILSQVDDQTPQSAQDWVRGMVAKLVLACPMPLVVQVGRLISAFNREEWRKYEEQN